MKWLLRVFVVVAVLYATLFAVVGVAMMRPPVQFGQFTRRQ